MNSYYNAHDNERTVTYSGDEVKEVIHVTGVYGSQWTLKLKGQDSMPTPYLTKDELTRQLETRVAVYEKMRDGAAGNGYYDVAARYDRYIVGLNSLISDIEIDEIETP